MALNKPQLIAKLVQIFEEGQTTDNSEWVATQLADAIDEFVKTGRATGTDSHGDSHNLTIQ